ncbi:mechanosensitive ion channel family protein [Pseudodesulfovibrio sediminis]|uniref:Mechanosensitive ion channel protein n=1 Tax=Pseudodesulfovibrio sediminis TaxID=2810563 RepID=A0ABN6EXH9_9BACT|nr:mechanosensitive ion channel domain-containing protein [Pseudodesulfovibrio sediminis]BCS89754.1 mechanosensitive ion channel protein [Pseudodesulfovibrio sediminis]
MQKNLEIYLDNLLNWLQTNFLTPNAITQWVCILFGVVLVFSLGLVIGPMFRRWVKASVSNEFLRSLFSVTASVTHSLTFFLYSQICISFFVMKDDFPRWIIAASDLSIAWVAIRLSTYIIPNRAISRLVAFCVWGLALLHIVGLLGYITSYLQTMSLSMGGNTISVYGMIKGLILAAICLQLARVISTFTAKRIETSHTLSPSLQVLINKLINIGLYTAALLFTLSSIGLDLTSLTIFSSALGVGVGFGLRTIFANYISGILLLLDKSIKPGDVIELVGVFGTVRYMHARYASVLTRSGKEYLIPNEKLITNEVINWSYSNTNVRLVIPVGVSYASDIHQVKKIMEDATKGIKRILRTPPPLARLSGFGDSSVDMELCVWIADAEDGVGNVTSEVLFNIWDLFKENDIEIPFPQRDLHIKSGSLG